MPDTDTAEEATVSPRTRVWVACDFSVEGPEASSLIMAVIEEGQDMAGGHLIGWRLINPASETDKAEFAAVGEDLTRIFEEEGPMESMFAEVPDGC